MRQRLIAPTCIVIAALIAAGCSGETPSRAIGTPGEASAPTFDPDLGRSAGTPEEAESETAATIGDEPVQVDSSTDVVHILGSIRAEPELNADWANEIPIVQNDLATIASLSCDQGAACDPVTIASWAEERVEIVNLATSANVLSSEELVETESTLEEAGVAIVGYGQNTEAALSPIIFDNGDIAVAIHAISLAAVPEVTASDNAAGIVGPELFDSVHNSIAASRASELGVVVIVDWGNLDARAPTEDELSEVELLIDAGADAVVGHGSDFLQRFDQIGSGIVSFGLGNAVTTNEDPLRRDASVLRLEFDRPGRSCQLQTTATTGGPQLDDQTVLDCGG